MRARARGELRATRLHFYRDNGDADCSVGSHGDGASGGRQRFISRQADMREYDIREREHQ